MKALAVLILIIMSLVVFSGCTNSDVVAVVDEQGDLHTVYSYQPLVGGWTLIMTSGGIFLAREVENIGRLEDWEVSCE